MKLIPTIGLEIHAELLTASKVFCTCSAEFGGEPNSRCCPVCSGLPGTLPVLNKKAVEYIIRAGYVTNCDISRFTKWDRKNYFYPDLPKAYQISQMPRPVCLGGNVKINVGGEEKAIRINRIHLEEDAGKLVHDERAKISLADYNRCGIPLIETVTEPDFHSAEEVTAFVEKLRLLYVYSGISDGKMEQGSLRCDVNISLAEAGAPLGTRAEIKNINSLRNISRAIEFEIYRQTEILEGGGRVIQETRRFNDALGETTGMRSKEDAQDYRYFPDPDIPPIVFTEEELENIKRAIPMLAEERFELYTESYKIAKNEAETIINNKALSDLFDEALKCYNNPKTVSAFLLVELMRRVNLGEANLDDLPFGGKELAELVEMGDTDKVNKGCLKDILRVMLESGKTPHQVADEQNLWIKEDLGAIDAVIDEIIANNPNPVAQYRSGDQKVFGFFMGQANKALKGQATPKAIQEALRKKLEG